MARSPLSAGDEVWGFYGHKSDSQLVASYGFTCAPAVENPFNSVELLVDMDLDRPSTSALASMKHVLLRSLGLDSARQSFIVYKGVVPPTLLLFLTMDSCDDEHGEAVLQAAASFAIASVPRHLALHLLSRAYSRLARFCKQLLGRYGTSLVEDVVRLKRPHAARHGQPTSAVTDGGRHRLALMLRMGEKDVLESLSAAAGAAQAVLQAGHVSDHLLLSLARGDVASLTSVTIEAGLS